MATAEGMYISYSIYLIFLDMDFLHYLFDLGCNIFLKFMEH